MYSYIEAFAMVPHAQCTYILLKSFAYVSKLHDHLNHKDLTYQMSQETYQTNMVYIIIIENANE